MTAAPATPARPGGGLSPANHLWGARLYARTRRTGPALVVCLLSLAVLASARSATLHVPFAPELVVVQAFLVAPIVPVVVLGITLATPLADLEDVTVERLRLLRAAHLALLVAVLAVTSLATAGLRGPELLAVTRNSALLLGLLLLAAGLFDPQLAWLAPLLPAAVCFFFGKNHDDGSVHAWALMLRPVDLWSAVVAGALLAAGAGLFLWRGPHRS